jgi:hypothetical protein
MEQIAGVKNDHATSEISQIYSIAWVRALVLMLFKKDPPNLYQIEFSNRIRSIVFQR